MLNTPLVKVSYCIPVYTSPLKASNACLAFSGVNGVCQLRKRPKLRSPSLSLIPISCATCGGDSWRSSSIRACECSRKSGWVARVVWGGVSKSKVLAGEINNNIRCRIPDNGLRPGKSEGLFGLEQFLPPIQRGNTVGGIVAIAVHPAAVAHHFAVEDSFNGIEAAADMDGIHQHPGCLQIQLTAEFFELCCQPVRQLLDIVAGKYPYT